MRQGALQKLQVLKCLLNPPLPQFSVPCQSLPFSRVCFLHLPLPAGGWDVGITDQYKQDFFVLNLQMQSEFSPAQKRLCQDFKKRARSQVLKHLNNKEQLAGKDLRQMVPFKCRHFLFHVFSNLTSSKSQSADLSNFWKNAL